MKRPKGITALSILFVLFGAKNFWGTVAYLSLSAYLNGVLNLLMGLSAMATAVGLWKLRAWATIALTWWAAFCVVRFVLFIKQSTPITPLLQMFVVIAVFIAIVVALHLYIHRTTRSKPVWVKQ